MKMQIFLKSSMTKGHIGQPLRYGEGAWLSYFQFYNFITNFTYVLKNNFCPCLIENL